MKTTKNDKTLSMYTDKDDDLLDKPDNDAEYMEDPYTDEESDEEDPNSLLVQAKYYTYDAVHGMLRRIISNFAELGMDPKDLQTIAKVYMLTEKPGKYHVEGYISLIVKDYIDDDEFTYRDLKFDGDGLELEEGSWTNEYGYGHDSVSTIVYPIYDEDEAFDIIQNVDGFTAGFYESLASRENIREFADFIDSIDSLSKG